MRWESGSSVQIKGHGNRRTETSLAVDSPALVVHVTVRRSLLAFTECSDSCSPFTVNMSLLISEPHRDVCDRASEIRLLWYWNQ